MDETHRYLSIFSCVLTQLKQSQSSSANTVYCYLYPECNTLIRPMSEMFGYTVVLEINAPARWFRLYYNLYLCLQAQVFTQYLIEPGPLYK